MEWKGTWAAFCAKGSKGSSSSVSSSRRTDERRDELGVRARDWSAISGAAMARFDVALSDQRSGDGESARKRDPGDDAADNGRGMGLNS